MAIRLLNSECQFVSCVDRSKAPWLHHVTPWPRFQLSLVTESRRVALSSLEADSDDVDQIVVFMGTAVAASFGGASLE